MKQIEHHVYSCLDTLIECFSTKIIFGQPCEKQQLKTDCSCKPFTFRVFTAILVTKCIECLLLCDYIHNSFCPLVVNHYTCIIALLCIVSLSFLLPRYHHSVFSCTILCITAIISKRLILYCIDVVKKNVFCCTTDTRFFIAYFIRRHRFVIVVLNNHPILKCFIFSFKIIFVSRTIYLIVDICLLKLLYSDQLSITPVIDLVVELNCSRRRVLWPSRSPVYTQVLS